MPTTPQLTNRASRQVEVVFNTRRDLLAFELAAANTLDVAYAGATAMFQVMSGGTFRSPGIKAKRLGRTQYSNRGLTRALYDPQDYWVAAGALPPDANQGYIRASEVAPDGTVGPQGPIMVVPAPNVFTNPRPRLPLAGTAPSLTTPADLHPPVDAMHIVLPRFADYVDIYNKDAGVALYVAFGTGSPGIIVPAATQRNLWDAAFKEMYIWGDGATVAFDMYVALVNGEMA